MTAVADIGMLDQSPGSRLAVRRGLQSLSRGMGWAGVVVVVVVLVANATYLIGVFDPNPLLSDSGLARITRPGPLPGLDNIDPNIGFTSQTFGHLAALDWLHGHVPWWNPYEGVGSPLAGEMQGAPLFPLTLLDAFSNGQIFFRVILELAAGLSTLKLLQRVGCGDAAATIGAVVFALNGTFSWMFHSPGNPIAFLPLALLGCEVALDRTRQGRTGGWVLLGVALALSLYAGFPEVAFIDGILVALWVLVRACQLAEARLTYLAKVAAGLSSGLLVALPVLVTFLTYLPRSDIGGHSGAYAHAALPARTALPGVLFPYIFGPIFGFSQFDSSRTVLRFWGSIGGFLGCGVCFLALIGLFGRRWRLVRLVLMAWVLVGLARMVGQHWALVVVNAIPGVKTTAFYRYAPPSWEMATAVLAAFGADDLFRAPRLRRRVVLCLGGFLVACALAISSARSVLHLLVGAPHHRGWAAASVGWGIGAAVCLAAASLMPKKVRVAGVTAVLIVDVLVMFAVPQFSSPRAGVVDMAPVAFLRAHLGDNRFFTLGPLSPNYGSYFDLGSVAVNDTPMPKAYANYIRTQLNTNVDPLVFTGNTMVNLEGPSDAEEFIAHLPAYENLSVRYVLAPTGFAIPPDGAGALLREVFSDASVTIYEIPAPAPYMSSPGGACEIVPESRTTAEVDCRTAGTVVRRELWMPGWSAAASGRALAMTPVDGLFQAVHLPAGRSRLVFTFAPPHIRLALAGLVVGVALLCLSVLRGGRIRSMPAHRRPPARRLAPRLRSR